MIKERGKKEERNKNKNLFLFFETLPHRQPHAAYDLLRLVEEDNQLVLPLLENAKGKAPVARPSQGDDNDLVVAVVDEVCRPKDILPELGDSARVGDRRLHIDDCVDQRGDCHVEKGGVGWCGGAGRDNLSKGSYYI